LFQTIIYIIYDILTEPTDLVQFRDKIFPKFISELATTKPRDLFVVESILWK